MILKDLILSMVRIEDVVQRYLPLHRNGSSSKTMLGLCPFHDDRHPSLSVNVKEQYYKCFACGEGGDLFKFVQKMEGCDFSGALKILAGWYGLSEADEYRPAKFPPVRKIVQSVSEELVSQLHIDGLLRSCRMFFDLLEEYQPEDEMLRETYKAFEVGLAPASLPSDYKNYCNRIVFPIRNEEGVLVAFAGRYQGETKGTDIRKYINSPSSTVYKKGEILYGLYQAREAIRQHGFVYVTEGYKDVLAMHAAGFRNTVALCGTALTDQHIALLGRYIRRVVVMLDGDAAGEANSYKSACLLLSKGFSVGQIILQPQHDPDSLLREIGSESFIGYIKSMTRFGFLETYEKELLRQIEQLLAELKLALTIDERTALFSRMIILHKRLGKVTQILKHAPVSKAGWLLRTAND